MHRFLLLLVLQIVAISTFFDFVVGVYPTHRSRQTREYELVPITDDAALTAQQTLEHPSDIPMFPISVDDSSSNGQNAHIDDIASIASSLVDFETQNRHLALGRSQSSLSNHYAHLQIMGYTNVLLGIATVFSTVILWATVNDPVIRLAVTVGATIGLMVFFVLHVFYLAILQFRTIEVSSTLPDPQTYMSRDVRGLHPTTRTHQRRNLTSEQLSEICVICQEELSDKSAVSDTIVETCRGHFFHEACLLRLYATSDWLCPICRSIYEDDSDNGLAQ